MATRKKTKSSIQAKNRRVKSKNKRRRVVSVADKVHNDKSYTMENVIRDNPFMLDDVETTIRIHPTWNRVKLMKLKQKKDKRGKLRPRSVSNRIFLARQKIKTK